MFGVFVGFREVHYIVDGNPLDWRTLSLVPSQENTDNPTKSKAEPEKPQAKTPQPLSLEDKQILELAKQRYGGKFERLLSSDSSGYLKSNGEPDVSRADCAFILILRKRF